MWRSRPGRRKHLPVILMSMCLLPCTAVATSHATPPPLSAAAATNAAAPMALGAIVSVAEANFKERLLLVDINQQKLNETVMLLEGAGSALYVSVPDLQRWRLRLPEMSAAIDYEGVVFVPVKALAGVSQVLNLTRLTLMLEARPEAFLTTARDAATPSLPQATQSKPGGFINYDLFVTHDQDATRKTGQLELGVFNRFGVGTGTILIQQPSLNAQVTRLDTTWTVDYPEARQSLRIGDAVSRPGSWGRSTRFGGVQFGSNFATQPGFVTFPLQSVAGQAVLPSTVDVFVNNALVSRQNVPPGPFSISNLPVVTGTGEVRLVVRDVLGREQLVTQPFYASQALLREGLVDFSSELGLVRNNFGISSFDYGSWLGSSTVRRGMSDHFTGELHAEIMRNQVAVGGGGDYLLPGFGTISTYAAGSRSSAASSPTRSGGLLAVGFERQAARWSLSARTQWMQRGFTQVGDQAGDLVVDQSGDQALSSGQPQPLKLPAARISSFSLGVTTGGGVSVGFGFVDQRNRDQPDLRIATLSLGMSLGKWASISLSALRNMVGEKTTTLFAMVNVPLGMATSAGLSAETVRGAGRNREGTVATLQRNLPSGEGFGYRAMVRDDSSGEASLTLQNNVGTYTAGVARSGGSISTRLDVSGGVAFLGGDVFPSRRIDQSFAVVRIPDYPNVRVYADNQPAGRTDARGNALIPRLRAYDNNLISIEQRDLPMDATIGSLKLRITPYLRSGVDVTFPIKHSRSATLTIRLDDGTALPVGATVRVADNGEQHVVGYDGEVYVVGLAPRNRLRANWRKQECDIDVPFSPTKDPLPHLGSFVCKGVQP